MKIVVKSHVVHPALRLLGVIGEEETPTAQEAQDAVDALNLLLDGWGATRLYPFVRATRFLATVPGRSSYLVGPGDDCDLVAPWPSRVDFAARREDGSDYQLSGLTPEAYAVVQDKGASGTPTAYLYEPTTPDGTLTLWPVPSAAGVIVLTVMDGPPVVTLDDELDLPAGYADALKYSLAVKLAPEFGREPPASVVALAEQALRVVRRARLRTGMAACPPRDAYFNLIGW